MKINSSIQNSPVYTTNVNRESTEKSNVFDSGLDDEFERNLKPEDLKYFIYSSGQVGKGCRFPAEGVLPSIKKEWLSYAKELEKDGLTPEDMSLMDCGCSPLVFFPPRSAPAEVKKKFCEMAKTMNNEDIADLKTNILLSQEKKIEIKYSDENSVKKLRDTIEGITSYKDLFSELLDKLNESDARCQRLLQYASTPQEAESYRNAMHGNSVRRGFAQEFIEFLQNSNIA